MIPRNLATICVLLASVLLLCNSSVAATYRWQLTNPNGGQLSSYRSGGGVLVVASVHTTNGCQTPFLVPERTPFFYDLKIRILTGPIFCSQIVQDRLVAFYEIGTTSSVRVKTASGVIAVPARVPPSRPPLP
jgi:hypothetical protein